MQSQQTQMTPRDLIDLGYPHYWVALANRIARRMQMKAAHQVVISARKAGMVK